MTTCGPGAGAGPIRRRFDAVAVTQFRIEQVRPEVTYPLRQQVLRPQLSVAEVALQHDDDPQTVHLAAFDEDGTVLGIARIAPAECPWSSPPGPGWQLRSMATAPQQRGQGIGARLLERAVQQVELSGGGVMWCNARSGAQRFYERAGFMPAGVEWDDPDFGPHLAMIRAVGR